MRPLSREYVVEFGLFRVPVELAEDPRGKGGFRDIDWSKGDKNNPGGFVNERGRWPVTAVCGLRDERMKTGKTSGADEGSSIGNREPR